MTRPASRSVRFAVVAVACAAAMSAPLRAQPVAYPATRTVDQSDVYFGTRVADPYRWLEDINGAETAQWVAAENGVTNAYLAALPGREALRQRITALWNYPKVSVPYHEGGQLFYTRNSGLQRQNVWYSRAALGAAERVVLDPNQLSPDGSVALSGFSPSPDGKSLAYGQSEGGSDWVTYYVRGLAAGAAVTDTVRWVKFSGASWTHDGKGFFYSRFPTPSATGDQLKVALRDQKVYYHRLGTPQSSDRLIFERPDHPTWFVGGRVDDAGRYLFLTTSRGSDNKNELYVVDLGNPMSPNVAAPVRPLYTGHDAEYAPLGAVGSTLYLQTDRDAPRRRIVAAALATPAASRWRTVVPQGANTIESATLVAGRIAVQTLEDVASAVRLYMPDGRAAGTISLPALGTVGAISGRFDRPEMFYAFTSPLYPTTVFAYDVKAARSTAFEAPKTTLDPSKYVTERVFYHSKDGTRVPMFVTYRKGMARDGTNPTMLYAYGGFDISMLPSYRPDLPAWLDLGGVYAVANLRGGGEYGEAWHEAGMFEKKQNVFDDFIAAGEYLVKEKYTSPAKLAINGGSNGGLLIGAVMEQRPDLFGAAVPQVGVMDMLRYHQFSGGRAWATEYGAADDSTAFGYISKYSPLQNVKQGVCYPATLITTADHDDRVVPSHSFKFAAAMQAAQSKVAGCDKPILIRIESQGSHGYRPTDKRIAELADIWAFTAKQLGVTVPVTLQ